MNPVRSRLRDVCGQLLAVGLLAIVSGHYAAGEIIPAARLYTAGWETAGVTGGIPNQSAVHATINSTGDTTDRTSAINSAISSCPPGQVVVLGPGTFRCNSAIVIGTNKQGVVLRGSGVGVTIIDSRADNHAVLIGTGGGDWPWPTDGPALSADAPAGATVIPMSSTSGFAVGNHVRFSQAPDLTLPVIDVSSVDRRAQLHHTTVVATTATTITIEDPLPFALTTALDARTNVIGGGYTENCGVEDLTIDCQNASPVDGVKVWNAYKCWLNNLHIILPQNHNVYMLCAIHCEVRKVFSDRIANQGSNGGGILIERSSLNLIVDSIIYDSFPNLEANFGCTGNVFAYNVWDDATGPTGVWGMSVNTNHGAHNSFNLHEGNVTPSFQPDGYFGSVSHDTIFRNRVHGYQAYNKVGDAGGSVAIKLKRFTRYYNVVGNILGTPRSSAVYEHSTSGESAPAMYQLGYPNIGNHGFSGTAEPSTGDWWASWRSSTGPGGYQERDLDVANTLLRKGNYNTVNSGIPASESTASEALPPSLFLPGKPIWFKGLAWPPFDPANPVIDMTASVTAIPAGYRYLNGTEPPGTGGDQVAPTTPQNVSAVASNPSEITIAWAASTDNVAVSGYRVERSQGDGSTVFAQVGSPGSASFINTGLSGSTVYNYRVRAIDAAGNLSAYSTVVTATTPVSSDTTPPSVPQNVAAAATAANVVTLSWARSSDNVGVTGYQVERSQGTGSTTFAQIATPTANSLNDTGLTEGGIYNYRVRAGDAMGNWSAYSNIATVTSSTPPDTVAPTVPANLVVSVASPTQINLSWTASTDLGGVAGYRVERSQGTGSAVYTLVGSPTGNSFVNSGLTADTVYNYRVRAVDSAANMSGFSNVATAFTASKPGPTGLVAAYSFDEGSGATAVDWSPNGNSGAISAATWTTGKFGRALAFNGTTSVVTISNSPSLQVANALTLEAWVYRATDDKTKWRPVIYRPNTSPGDVNYVLQGVSQSASAPSFGLSCSTENLFSTQDVPLNSWSHVAATYDGAAMRLFVNGVQTASKPQTGTLSPTSQSLLIGLNWEGLIDEVRVYNRALSVDEIQGDMALPVGPRPAAPTNLRIK